MKNIKKKISENFNFLVVEFSIYLNRQVSIMWCAGKQTRSHKNCLLYKKKKATKYPGVSTKLTYNVVSSSPRRHDDVAATSKRRCYNVVCLLDIQQNLHRAHSG